MSINSHIEKCIEDILSKVRSDLSDKGVGAEILDEVFGHLNECDHNNGEPSVKSSRRMLSGNKSSAQEGHTPSEPVTQPTSFNNSNYDNPPFEKCPQNWSGDTKVVLILNYTPKTHALFGDFGKTYSKFKDSFLSPTKWMSYNDKLFFGPGWVMMQKTNLTELIKALNAAKISFRVVEKVDFEKEVKVKVKSSPSEAKKEPSDAKPEVKPKTEMIPSKSLPEKIGTKIEKKSATTTGEISKEKIKKNQWGNYEGSETGVVFDKLPVGKDGRLLNIVVGIQDPEPKKGSKLLDTVLCLQDDYREDSISRGYKILTDAMVEVVRKIDAKKAEELDAIIERKLDDGEDDVGDEDDIDEDEEDEDDS